MSGDAVVLFARMVGFARFGFGLHGTWQVIGGY